MTNPPRALRPPDDTGPAAGARTNSKEKPVAPSIKIQRWNYTRVETSQSNHVAAEFAAGVTPVAEMETMVLETVGAVFEIIDGEPFAKRKRSTNEVRPEQLHVRFTSHNNETWRVDYRVMLTGANIKKDGTLGAEQEVDSLYFPDWAREMYSASRFGSEPGGPAADWIYAEYPR